MYQLPALLPSRSRHRAENRMEPGCREGWTQPVVRGDAARSTLDRVAFRYKPGRGANDISHAEAKEVLFALGVSRALYDAAHRGNVMDAVKNTLVRQVVALPSRFVRFGAIGAFDALSPVKSLADFGSDPAALARHQAGREVQARMLTYAGQHLRGGAHFVLNALANPIDLSSHARSLPPQVFARDGSIASCILAKLHEGLAHLEAQLRGDLPAQEMQQIKAHLHRCAAALQPEVDRFVEAQGLGRQGSDRNVDSVLRGVTELVDTSGKIIIASLMDAAVPGLSRTGLQQLWSLVSYPLMEGVIRAVQNWRDTVAIARIALGQYLRAKDHKAWVSDERLDEIARYAQAHFEPASVANYKRRMTRLFEPRLLELRTRLAGRELEQQSLVAKSNAASLVEFELIGRRGKLQNQSLADAGRIRLSPARYSASMELAEMLTGYLRSRTALTPVEVALLVEFNIESLLDVHVAPTAQAAAAFDAVVAAMQARGIADGRAHLAERFQSHLAEKRRELVMVPDEDVHAPLYPEQPVSATFTDRGRAKLAATASLDEVSRNLRLRQRIARREGEVDALSGQIAQLSRHPPHDGFLDQLELAARQRRLARPIARNERAIARLKAQVDRYAADVGHYRDKNFEAISPGGEVWEGLMSGDTGAAAAVRRTLRHGLLDTLNSRRSLGLAMSVAYDPTLSGFGATRVASDPLANSLAEGFLNAGMPVAALAIPVGARFIKPAPQALSHVSRGLAEADSVAASEAAESPDPAIVMAPVSDGGRRSLAGP